MLGNAPPRSSSLNLVKIDLDLPTAEKRDVKIAMADLVESLDTRELDIDEGEETDYDGSALGELPKYHVHLKLVRPDNRDQSKWSNNVGGPSCWCIFWLVAY